MNRILSLLSLLVLVFTQGLQGCGNYHEYTARQITVYSPASGEVFIAFSDKPMYIEYDGPADEIYQISFVLIPKCKEIFYDGYSEKAGGYIVGRTWFDNPVSRYVSFIYPPFDVPAGIYILRIIFSTPANNNEVSHGDSAEFEIRNY